MDSAKAAPGQALYENLFERLDTQGWVSGRVTAEEAFTNFRRPELEDGATAYPREDYIADPNAKFFHVTFDPAGKVGWTTDAIRYENRPVAHLVEVLTGRSSDDYVAYLRKHGISYIFAGNDSINVELSLEKLRSLFGIERLAVSGGGVLNASFLHEGLIDELSLLIAPVLDDETESNTTFERPPHLVSQVPAEFSLHGVEVLDGETLWLRYRADFVASQDSRMN